MKGYDLFLNGKPISKIISDKLEAGLKEDTPISFAKTDNEQCGTISWSGVSLEKLKAVTAELETIHKETFFDEKVKVAKELNRKMNEYLEGKIRKYLSDHLLSFVDWSRDGKSNVYTDGRYEYFYKDDFICGAQIKTAINKVSTNLDSQIELILY